MTDKKRTRRDFLLASMAMAGSVAGNAACQRQPTSITSDEQVRLIATDSPPTAMPQRVLGGTGIRVPLLGLGGAGRTPLSRAGEEKEAIAIIERAIELGIGYFDTAANYGPSEERLGKVLPPHRKKLFLASKTGQRGRDEAWRDLEQSLQRLQTDYLDLWQFHALTYDWDLNTILDEKNGAIQVAEAAKQQGLVRFVGITGHYNPTIIAQGLRRYPFDTALIPVNAADKHSPSPFITEVLPVAQQQNAGIIAMKVPAYGRLIDSGVLDGMRQAMGYAMSQPGVHCCIIAAETVPQLEHNVNVARAFQPLSAEELSAIEQRTAANWQDFSFFRDWA